jgi:hypothetical protein
MYLDMEMVARKAASAIAEKFPQLSLAEAEECAEIVMQEEQNEMVRVGIIDDAAPK